jgi:pyridoxamine 5'-phosphate oxidase
MIDLSKINNKFEPYIIFQDFYNSALKAEQKQLEAINISSYQEKTNEVFSRFVNIKFVEDEKWIFFSNYNSPKAKQFNLHNQIAAVFYWSSINVQIRMKANIKKTSKNYNQKYFFDRSEKKNALAISSNQSKPTDSYKQVKENYNKSLKNEDLKKCPEYWGGFSFTPYYFEFWEGHDSRLNKRKVFEKIDDVWKQSFLQP